MKKEKIKKLIRISVIFFSFSFIGWFWELLYEFLRKGTIANHGVLLGPWLPIYGFGALLIYLCLSKYKYSPLLVFMGSFVLCTSVEYITAWYLETFVHRSYWNYSYMPFNIDGRICLLASLFFGFAGLISLYIVIPKLFKFLDKFEYKKIAIICLLLTSIFIIDKIHSYQHPNIIKRYKIIDTNEIKEMKLFKK